MCAYRSRDKGVVSFVYVLKFNYAAAFIYYILYIDAREIYAQKPYEDLSPSQNYYM